MEAGGRRQELATEDKRTTPRGPQTIPLSAVPRVPTLCTDNNNYIYTATNLDMRKIQIPFRYPCLNVRFLNGFIQRVGLSIHKNPYTLRASYRFQWLGLYTIMQ